MTKKKVQQEVIGTSHLGQKSEKSNFYDPTLLRRIERRDEREKSGISILPFYGMDVWNGYEFTFLNFNGRPLNFLLKIMYSSDSPYIVESKSLKLYLNSFAMTKFEDVEIVRERIMSDLTELLQYRVHVMTFNLVHIYPYELTEEPSYPLPLIELDYRQLSESLVCDTYNRDINLLEVDPSKYALFIKSSSLRSNCKVTNQPDYGDIYIAIIGKSIPTYESLFKYIVSYRNENHFHEEIVEQIYQDLVKVFKPEELFVMAKYTRRGGIDINPIRYSHLHLIDHFCKEDVNINRRFEQEIRQ